MMPSTISVKPEKTNIPAATSLPELTVIPANLESFIGKKYTQTKTGIRIILKIESIFGIPKFLIRV